MQRVPCQRIYSKIDHIKIRQKAWYQANIEALSKKWRAYGIENREKINQKSRAWYAANKDRVSENGRAWRSANREARAASCRNRRRMKYSADGKHTAFEVLSIFEHQRGLCAACNCKLLKSGRERFHVDHITPLLRGGSNDKYNLQCLCPFCNLSKGAKDPIQWAEQNGRLLLPCTFRHNLANQRRDVLDCPFAKQKTKHKKVYDP